MLPGTVLGAALNKNYVFLLTQSLHVRVGQIDKKQITT